LVIDFFFNSNYPCLNGDEGADNTRIDSTTTVTDTGHTENASKNQTLQSLLLQFQKNSLLPKLMKRKFDSANRPPLLNQIPVSSSFFVSQNSEGCKISIESHTGLVKSTCERTFCGNSLGLDSEFNSIHFGIEINKCLKFLRANKFLGPKN
jgi:hypothetical protein